MSEENENISAKTWARAADSISKVGYADGAADGQTATFQSCFDKGYELGFNFGFQLGFKKAKSSIRKSLGSDAPEMDVPRKMNCQICTKSNIAQNNTKINDLYNSQKEHNEAILILVSFLVQ